VAGIETLPSTSTQDGNGTLFVLGSALMVVGTVLLRRRAKQS
jgi:LPXTG-motif cell wall-anchored protein